MSKKAKFITIEGLEGAGKSTLMQFLEDYFKQHKLPYITTREPGGTELSEGLRDLLKKNYTEEIIYPETEVLLLYAARLQLVNNIIKPALDNNTWVLGDRHDLSTIAYQAGGRGVSIDFISRLKKDLLGDFEFDLCLYLDIEPKIGLERARSRSALDRIEQESLDFFNKIRQKYLELAKSNKKIIVINANNSVNNIRQEVLDILNNYCG